MFDKSEKLNKSESQKNTDFLFFSFAVVDDDFNYI